MARKSQAAKFEPNIVFEQEEIQRVSRMDLFSLLEERRIEAQNQQDILHKRIGSLRDELHKEISESHKEIMSEIREMKEEQREHARDMSERVSRLEQWKWQVAGGILVLAFIWPFVSDFMG
jgi:gas vesicle protein